MSYRLFCWNSLKDVCLPPLRNPISRFISFPWESLGIFRFQAACVSKNIQGQNLPNLDSKFAPFEARNTCLAGFFGDSQADERPCDCDCTPEIVTVSPPKNRHAPKRKLIFQKIIFQGRTVKFRGCKSVSHVFL